MPLLDEAASSPADTLTVIDGRGMSDTSEVSEDSVERVDNGQQTHIRFL